MKQFLKVIGNTAVVAYLVTAQMPAPQVNREPSPATSISRAPASSAEEPADTGSTFSFSSPASPAAGTSKPAKSYPKKKSSYTALPKGIQYNDGIGSRGPSSEGGFFSRFFGGGDSDPSRSGSPNQSKTAASAASGPAAAAGSARAGGAAGSSAATADGAADSSSSGSVSSITPSNSVSGPGNATSLTFSTAPSTTTDADSALATQPVVTALTSSGTAAPSYSGTITLTAYSNADCTGAVADGVTGGTAVAVSGVATFAGVKVVKTNVQSVLASDGALSVCQSGFSVSPGAVSTATSTLSVSAASVISGNSITVTLTALDANGNSNPTGVGAVTFSSTIVGGTGSFGATNNAGGGVYTANFTGDQAGLVTISGVIGGATITETEDVTVQPNNPTQLAFTTEPSANGVAGQDLGQQPVVAIKDANGNTVPTATDNVVLSLYSNAACTVAAATAPDGSGSVTGTLTVAASSGVATFSGLAVTKAAGALYFKATSGALSTDCSSAMNIAPGAFSLADSTLSVPAPAEVVSGAAIVATLTAKDDYGNANPSGITTVAFDSTVVGGTGTFDTPVDAGSGVYTVNFTGDRAGVVTLSATIDGSSVTDTQDVTVLPGAVDALVYTTNPSSTGDTDTALAQQPVITAQDAQGNTVTSYTSAITLTGYSDAACTVAVAASVAATTNPLNAVNGVATYAGVRILKTSVQSLKASDGTLSACYSTLTISPGALDSIAFTTQPAPTSIDTDTAFTTQPVVTAYDANLNIISTDSASNIVLTANDTAGCSGATIAGGLSGTTTKTVASGVATYTDIQVVKTGVKALLATLGTETACSNTLTIAPGAIDHIAFTTQPAPTTTDTDDGFTTQPVVTVYDANNNVITSDSASNVVLTANDTAACAGAVVAGGLSGTTTKTVSSGVATYTDVQPVKTSVKALLATLGAKTACSDTLTIDPGAATTLVFTTEPSATGIAGADLAQQPVVTVRDAAGNTVVSNTDLITLSLYSDATCSTAVATAPDGSASIGGTAAVAASSGVATFTDVAVRKAAGALYFKASSGALATDCSSAMNISPGAFSLADSTVTTPAPKEVESGDSIVLTLTAKDDYGNANPSGITAVAFASTVVGGTGTFDAPVDAGSGVYTVNFTGDRTGVVTVSATINAGNVTDTEDVTVLPGGIDSIVFTTNPSSTGDTDTALAQQPVVTGQDAQGNTVVAYTGSITLTGYSDATCTTLVAGSIAATTNPVTASNGVATFAGVKVLKTSVQSIRASDGTRTACYATLTISPGALDSIAFTTQPAPTSNNTDTAFTTQPVVTAYDANMNVITTDSASNIVLTANDTAGCTGATVAGGLSGTTTKTVASGVATYTDIKAVKTSVKALKATLGTETACSDTLTIGAGAIDSIAFTTQPAPTSNNADDVFTTQPVVTAYDANGNVVTSDSASNIVLSANDAAGCAGAAVAGGLAGTTTGTLSSGVATYTDIQAVKTNVKALVATLGAKTACSDTLTIAPGALDSIAFTTQPAPTTHDADTAFTTQPAVTAYDAHGNVITTDSASNIVLTANDTAACAGATVAGGLAGTTTKTVASGVATYTDIKAVKTTVKALKATLGAETACSDTLTIGSGAITELVFSTTPSTSGDTDTVLAQQPVVTARDANGNTVTGYTGAITLTGYSDTACTAAVAGSVAATTNPLNAVAGVATFAGVKILKTSVQSIKASNGTQEVCFDTLTIAPGALDSIAFTTQPGPTTNDADTAFTTQPRVTAYDANMNVITTDSASNIVLTANDTAGCTGADVAGGLSGTTTKTVASGVATYTDIKAVKSTVKALKATLGSETACSDTLTIESGAATQLVFTTEPSATGVAGTDLTQQPVVTVRDANGNTVTASTDTVTLTLFSDATCSTAAATAPDGSGSIIGTAAVAASSGVVTYTDVAVTKAAATLYFKASSGALTTDCSSVMNISPGAFSLADSTVTTPAPKEVESGDSIVITLTAKDDYGNANPSGITAVAFDSTVVGGTGSFDAPVDAGSGVYTSNFTGDRTGVVTISATINAGNVTDTEDVTVIPGGIADIVFTTTPSTTGNTDTALAQQPVVTGQDAQGNTVLAYTGTITLTGYSDATCTTEVVGSIAATTNPVTATNGVATFAGVQVLKTSVKSIKASDGTRTDCFATLTIDPGALDSIAFTTQPAPTSNNTDTAFTTQPVITAYDANMNVITTDSASNVVLTANDTAGCAGADVAGGLSGTTTKQVSSGVATYTDIKAVKTTVKALKATLGTETACSDTLTIGAGAIDHIAFTKQPAPTSTNTDDGFSTQPVVTAYDANNNVVVSDSASNVVLTANDTAACAGAAVAGGLSGTTTKQLSSGVATYTDVKPVKVAVKAILATLGTKTACSDTLTISAGDIATLAFTTQPAPTSTDADTAFTTQPVVTAYDAEGNVVTGDSTSNIVLSANDTAACAGAAVAGGLSGTTTKQLASGVATYTDIQAVKTSVKALVATLGGITACSDTLTIAPGALDSIAFTTQPAPTTTDTATAFTTQPVVKAYDAHGNVITTDSTSNIVLTANDTAACAGAEVVSGLSGTTTKQVASGVATYTDIKAVKTGVKALLATLGSETACSDTLTINPGAASKLVFTTEPSAAGSAGTDLAQQPVVTVQDAAGNTVTSSTATIDLALYSDNTCTTAVATAPDGSASLIGTPSLAATSGVATFTDIAVTKAAATLYLKASSGALTTDCSNVMNIAPGAFSLADSTITSPAPHEVESGDSIVITLTAKDDYGNADPSGITAVAFASTAVGGTGTFDTPAETDGVYTVNFTGDRTGLVTISAKLNNTDVTDTDDVTVIAGSIVDIAFTTNPSTTGDTDTALASQPVVTGQDAQGNTVTSYTGSITLTGYSDATCTTEVVGSIAATTNPVTASNGVATFAGVTILKTSVKSIKASDGTHTDCFATLSIDPGALDSLAFTTQPAPTSNNTDTAFTTQPVVTAYDANMNVITTDSTSNIVLTANDTAGCTGADVAGGLSGTTTKQVASGVATYTDIKAVKTSVKAIKATLGSESVCSDTLTIGAGAIDHIAFSTQPAPTTTDADDGFTTQPVVTAYDANNNVVASDSASNVVLTANDTGGCAGAAVAGGLTGTTTKTLSSGVATYTDVKPVKVAVKAILATLGAKTACSDTLTISAGAIDSLAFTTQPAPTSTDADTAFTTQPVVKAYDANGNIVTSDSTSNIVLSANDTAACAGAAVAGGLSGTTTQQLASGVATYTDIQAVKTNVKALVATLGGITACSDTLTIAPGALDSIAFTTQPAPTTNDTATAFTTQPVVKAYDAHGNVITTDSTSNIVLTANDTAACAGAEVVSGLSGTTTKQVASGVATYTDIKAVKTGVKALFATLGSETACSDTLTINPGAASKLVFTTEPSATGTAGDDLAQQPVVAVQDAAGNTVTSSSATIDLALYSDNTCTTAVATAPDGSASMIGTASLAASSGVATFTDIAVTKAAATLYLKASSGALTTDCSAAMNISPAAFSLADSTVTTPAPKEVASGSSIVITLTAKDTYGNANPSGITAVAFGSTVVGGTGSFDTPADAGSGVYTVNFTGDRSGLVTISSTINAGNVTDNEDVTVLPGAIDELVYTTNPSSTGDTDTALAQQPVLTGQDAQGNTVTSYTSAITLTAYSDATCTTLVAGGVTATTNPLSATNGVATFAGVKVLKTNVQSLKASDGTRNACFATLTIDPGALDSIAFTTQPAPTSNDADTAFGTQPAVTAYDANMNVITTDSASNIVLSANDTAGCTGATVVSGLDGTTTKTVSSGVATYTDIKAVKVAVKAIKATLGTETACSNTLTIAPGALDSIAFTTQPAPTTNDTATAFTTQPVVTAYDAHGNVLSSDSTSNVVLTANDTAACAGAAVAGGLSGTTTRQVASGVATYTDIKAVKTSVKALLATLGTETACSSTLTINPGAASKLVFTTEPSATGTAGTNLAQQPAVSVQDAAGNTVTSSTATIDLALYSDAACTTTAVTTAPDGTASTSGTLSKAASSGVATFAGIAVKHAAAALYFKASSGALTTDCSDAMNISPGAFSLTKSTLAVSTANLAPGASLTTTLTAKDAYGNANPSGITAVTFDSTNTDGTGSFDATTDQGSGVHTATFTGATAGVVTLSGKINGSAISETEDVTIAQINLASATITNTSPTNTTTYDLTYGAITGVMAEYCILENDTTVGNCSWVTAASLPTSKVVSATQNAKVLSIWLKDAYDNVSDRVDTNSVTLDTTAPTSNSVSIAAGNLNTASTAPTLTLASTGASQMYITNTAGCGSDGSWEAYATSKVWTLGATNASTTVYVKFRDAAGNVSACVSDSIWQGNGTIFSDNFDDNSMSSAIWDLDGSDSSLENNASIRYSPPANTPAGGYKSMNSLWIDLTDAVYAIEAVQVLTPAADSSTQMTIAMDGTHYITFYTADYGGGSTLYFEYKAGGGASITSVPYVAATHRYWRLRHNSTTGKVYWDTSSDGTTWIERRAVATPFAVDHVTAKLEGGNWASQASPGTFIFDNAYVKKGVSSNFTGDWTFAATDTASYTYSTTMMDFTGGVVRLTQADHVDDGNTASGFGGGSGTGVAWDATNSYLRLSQTGTPTNNAALDSSWAPQWSSLVSYWKMDNDWNDSVGSNNGTAVNGPTFSTSSKIGSHAGALDGSNDYVDMGNSATLNFSNAITLSAWVYVTNAADQGPIFWRGGGWTSSGYQLLWCTDPSPCPSAQLLFELQNTGTAEKKSISTPVPAANTWNHLAATWDSTSDTMRLYVNGKLMGTQTFTGPIGAPPVNLEIGRTGATLNYTLSGRLDDLAMWSTALTAEEIRLIYDRQLTKYSGTFVSRVMDAFATGQSWTSLTWVPTLPFMKALPSYSGAVQNETSTTYSSLVGSTGSTSDNDLMSGNIGLWHLDETAATAGSPNDFDDDSASNKNLEAAGALFGEHGILGNAPYFDGSNDYISGAFSGTTLTTKLSLSFWMKPMSSAATRGVLQWANGLTDDMPFILIQQDGTNIKYYVDDNYRFTQAIKIGEWQHVAVTLSTTHLWRFYLNGVQVGTWQDDAVHNNQAAATTLYLGNGWNGYYKGFIDEVAVWNRTLHASEIKQLFLRGANRVKYQVRVCTAADCSDDSAGANWKGPDGTNQTYFSELFNRGTQAATPSGIVNITQPLMTFANFTNPVGTSRYFQYRTILESNDTSTGCNYGSGATWCSPELKSVTVAPTHYSNASPTVVGINGLSFYSLTALTQTLGANGCASGVTYNLSLDKVTWYWWNGSAWAAADGTTAKSNTAAAITTNAAAFGSSVGRGTVYFKAFLNGSGATACELDNLNLTGTHQ